jgi:uncharacterized protein
MLISIRTALVKFWVVISLVISAMQPGLSIGLTTAQAALISNDVVISQVFGGNGTVYTHDYVVLFNRGSSPVNLNAWSLQYASAGGNFGLTANITILPSFMLQPGQSFLVQLSGSTGGLPLPTPDAVGNLPLGSVGGKIALVSSSTLLPNVACPNPSSIR